MEGPFPLVDILDNVGTAGELKKPCQLESCTLEICLRQIRGSIEELLAAQEQRHQSELDKLRNSASADLQISVVADNQEHQGQLATMRGPARASETWSSYHTFVANDAVYPEFTRDELDEPVPGERSYSIHAVEAGIPKVDLHEQSVLAEPERKMVRIPSQRRSSIQKVHKDRKTVSSVGRHSPVSVFSRSTVASKRSAFSVTITTLTENFHQTVRFGKVLSGNVAAIQKSILEAQGGDFFLLELWGSAISKMLGEDILDQGMDFGTASSVLHGPRSARQCCNGTYQDLVTLRPRSRLRCCWDFTSIFVVLYDVAMSPMFIFEFEETYFDITLFWFTLSFWTLDIVLSFFTGYQVEGEIEMRFKKIVLKYLKGWFTIDMLAVMPDWIALFFSGDRASGFITRLGKAVKYLRTLRSLRLLRVFRLLRAWNGLRETVSNHYLVFIMQFAKFGILMFFLSHFSACAWYGISKLDEQRGWVYEDEVHSKDRFYMYLTSLHWSTSQLHGSMDIDAHTHLERSYAILYIYVSLIASSMFVSSITNVFIKMQKLREETFLKTHTLLSYLEDNHISSDLTARIQSFARHANDVSAKLATEVELLKTLPEKLLKDLSREIKMQVTKIVHPLSKMRSILPEVERGFLIDALSQTTVSPGTHLFHESEASGKMFILWRGKVIYDPTPATSEPNAMRPFFAMSRKSRSMFMSSQSSQSSQLQHVTVKGCCCMAEMNLWTNWQHQGDCIISGHPMIFSISAQSLCDALLSTQSQNMHLKLRLSLFISQYVERYLAWMNTMDLEPLTDLSVPGP